MLERIYRFETQVIETVPAFESFPIVDEAGKMLGSFARLQGDMVRGWVAGNDSPVALNISTGESFWFTPVLDTNGIVSHAIVSEQPVKVPRSIASTHVGMAQEYDLPRQKEADEQQTQ